MVRVLGSFNSLGDVESLGYFKWRLVAGAAFLDLFREKDAQTSVFLDPCDYPRLSLSKFPLKTVLLSNSNKKSDRISHLVLKQMLLCSYTTVLLLSLGP